MHKIHDPVMYDLFALAGFHLPASTQSPHDENTPKSLECVNKRFALLGHEVQQALPDALVHIDIRSHVTGDAGFKRKSCFLQW